MRLWPLSVIASKTDEMGVLYEKQTGVRVRLNLGASGLLQKQIEAGAPVDVFASAGMKQMDALQTGGLIAAESRRSFARNSLVLVVPSGSKLSLHSFAGLLSSRVTRLAIGNPKTVPAGQYAEQALKSMALWERLESRLVPAENVRQVLDSDKAELVVSCGVDFKMSITPATIRILNLKVGAEIYMLIKARAMHLLA
jgi:molybdate transport system substrate-binding protein